MSTTILRSHRPEPGEPQKLILLVEDDAGNAMVTSTILELLGYSYDIVSTGEKALEAIKEKSYALILMDMVLPTMHGIEVAKTIRAHEHASNSNAVPIIGITAEPSAEQKTACLDAGINEYLGKPLPIDLVKQMLSDYSQCTVEGPKLRKFIS